MFNDIIVFITSILSVIASGGWFIHWRLNKQQKQIEVSSVKYDFQEKIIDDLEKRVEKLMQKVLELENKCDTCEYKKT